MMMLKGGKACSRCPGPLRNGSHGMCTPGHISARTDCRSCRASNGSLIQMAVRRLGTFHPARAIEKTRPISAMSASASFRRGENSIRTPDRRPLKVGLRRSERRKEFNRIGYCYHRAGKTAWFSLPDWEGSRRRFWKPQATVWLNGLCNVSFGQDLPLSQRLAVVLWRFKMQPLGGLASYSTADHRDKLRVSNQRI